MRAQLAAAASSSIVTASSNPVPQHLKFLKEVAPFPHNMHPPKEVNLPLAKIIIALLIRQTDTTLAVCKRHRRLQCEHLKHVF